MNRQLEVLGLILSTPVVLIANWFSMLITLAARMGGLRTVRSRRYLNGLLRRIPTSRFWHQGRQQRLREKPFAIDLHTADPSSLIGLKKAEISSLLGRDFDDIAMMDHGKHYATWTNYSSAEVECFFREGEESSCVSCLFRVKAKRGRWEVVSRAP